MNIHDVYRRFSGHFRPERMRVFAEEFGVTEQTSILDVGGTAFNWSFLAHQPHVTVVNLTLERGLNNSVVADGRNLPFKDGAFDIVYSNSVLEHLGTVGNQQAFCDECGRVGLSLYLQTPDKRFFIEPHLLTPFIHWLPRGGQRRLLRNFTLWGLITRPSEQYCDRLMAEIRLLGEVELRQLLDDAEIWHERVFGFSKSLIAVKRASTQSGRRKGGDV